MNKKYWLEKASLYKNYADHELIAVPSQGRVKRYSCESYVELAQRRKYDTWDYEEFDCREDAIDLFGGEDELPDELKHAVFPCVAVTWPGLERYHAVIPAADFDAEGEAFAWLKHDLYELIVIDNDADAIEQIAYDQPRHMDAEITRAAQEIIDEHCQMDVELGRNGVRVYRVDSEETVDEYDWDYCSAYAAYVRDDDGEFTYSSEDEALDDCIPCVRDSIEAELPYVGEKVIAHIAKRAAEFIVDTQYDTWTARENGDYDE